MNFDLKYFENNSFLTSGKARKIKLRKLSFSNVFDKWNSFDNSRVVETTPSAIDETEAQNNYEIPIPPVDMNPQIPVEDKNEITKLPINIGNLSEEINIIDTEWSSLQSIKRRALALNKVMYENMINNTRSVFGSNIETTSENNIDIDEEEIKQAVKDAFDQINFNKQDVEAEVMISPEEVSNTVADSETPITENDNNDISFEFNNDTNNNEAIESNMDKKPIFEFEDINLSTIDKTSDDNFDSNRENKFIIEDFSSYDDEVDSSELQDLLAAAKELKTQQEEQQKKTENAHQLAIQKEAEKEKAKADFIAYQTSIKEELKRIKEEEEKELEKAREAEEFTAALVDIMNSNSNPVSKFNL